MLKTQKYIMWNGNENEPSFWFFHWKITLILWENGAAGHALGKSFTELFLQNILRIKKLNYQ
jgi:hypothetical protein